MSMVILVLSADSVYQQNLFFLLTFKQIFVFSAFLFLKGTRSSAGMNADQINDRQLTLCS